MTKTNNSTFQQSLQKKDYIQLSGNLFEDVQLSRIFPDSKTFVDCVPRMKPDEIQNRYANEKNKKNFDLKKFILEYFELPPGIKTGKQTTELPKTNIPIEQYIENLWSTLMRTPDRQIPGSTLIPLKYEYIVPGGRFREIYYWDSYFTSRGLILNKRQDIIINLCENFIDLINNAGHIPNGNRIYYLSRSQPPYLTKLIDLLEKNKIQKYKKFIPAVIQEYEFWMKGKNDLKQPGDAINHIAMMPDGSILNRFYDFDDKPREEAYIEDYTAARQLPEEDHLTFYKNIRSGAESGWDFSSRWFADLKNMRTINATEIIPIDLNSLLYFVENKIAHWYRKDGNEIKAQEYHEYAITRKKAIVKYLWSENDEYFFDYNFKKNKKTACWSLAGVTPLTEGIATQSQADRVAQHIQNKFLQPGGLTTTLHATGQQWDHPNGWAPLQLLAVEGLEKYGHTKLSQDIKKRWIKACEYIYNQTGNIFEKIDVQNPQKQAQGGEYEVQIGFGWTNGVTLDFIQSTSGTSINLK